MRRHLAKIGLVSDLSRMPFRHAELLEAVGNEFDRLEVAEMKKKRVKGQHATGAKRRV